VVNEIPTVDTTEIKAQHIEEKPVEIFRPENNNEVKKPIINTEIQNKIDSDVSDDQFFDDFFSDE